jgi:hypothetical protein
VVFNTRFTGDIQRELLGSNYTSEVFIFINSLLFLSTIPSGKTLRFIHAAVARYEMAGQIVPTTSQPSAFQQQGSTSWDNLASSTVQFSVGVLSRMSRAGL